MNTDNRKFERLVMPHYPFENEKEFDTPMTHTDKQPQTCYVFIKASDRLPLVTKKWYACNVQNKVNGHISGMMVYCAESNWDLSYPFEVIEFMESLPNLLHIHTPEELAQAFREVAERAIQKGVHSAMENCNELKTPFGSLPDFKTDKIVSECIAYLNQHYPLPQPINTNQ